MSNSLDQHFNRSLEGGNEDETDEMRVVAGHGQQLKVARNPRKSLEISRDKNNCDTGEAPARGMMDGWPK